MDVGQWLQRLGLGQYASAFAANDIDLTVLRELTDADLKELGVVSMGHRRRLLAAIAKDNETEAQANDTDAGAPTDERRQVAILFADLCGFTAMSQTLDPEELHDLVGRYTTLVDGIILNCGGTIDKHIGDAVMALFGAPRAHDDDPLRAARAALDIHDGLDRLSATAPQRLQAHIGIACGEVVAGAVRRADVHDYTVLGDSVNLAARLVSSAGPGQTLLSDAVYQGLQGRGICEPVGELRLKGIDAPARAWRLLGLSREPVSASRSLFVGREAELAQLTSSIDACIARRSGQVVYVRGEAGIGKTRLVEQMRALAEAKGFVAHRGLVLDFGVGRGQDPVSALLQSLLGLSATSGPEIRRDAAERAAAAGIVTAEELVFLHDVLDLPQIGEWRTLFDAMDNAARDRGRRALARTLAAHACRDEPTLIIVEDLHWANPALLGYLAAFAAAMAEGAGLLVITSRIEGDPLDAAWRAMCRQTPFATVDLGPLRREEAMSLAGGFIDATQRLAHACIERAGGNPLFLEQLLRNAEEGSSDSLPASIQSLVLARLDRLPQRDRLAFQAAAVIGQRFDLALLRRLIGVPDYVCDLLVSNALVLPEGEDFLFAHALIQEGAYSSLLRSRRRELHRQAADWFETRDHVLCAEHLDRAEDDGAPRAFLRAAAAQRMSYRLDSALRLVERGLVIARADIDRHALTCLKGDLLRDLGNTGESVAIYRLAVAAAPDEASAYQAKLGLAESLRVNEGLAEALILLDEVQPAFERRAMAPELARLHHLRGNIFFPLGNIDGCRDEHERGLGYAQRSGSPEAEARALGGLGDAAYAQGRMRTAFAHFSRCVALANQHGFGRIEVANRSMIGFSRVYLNEVRQALEDGEAAARAAALVGQPRAQMLGETMAAMASCEIGEPVMLADCLARLTPLTRQLGAKRFEAQALEMQARALLATGSREEATQLLREALAICQETGTQFCGPKVASALSCVVEDAAERAKLLAEGAAMLRRGSVGHNHLWFYRDAIEASWAAGDAAAMVGYAGLLETYTRSEPLPWADLFVARGVALAALLQHGMSEQLRQKLSGIRAALLSAELKSYLPVVEAALAA